MKEARISWRVSADIECPNCEQDIDFMDEDEWYLVCQIGEQKENMDYQIRCKKCKEMFKVIGSDY